MDPILLTNRLKQRAQQLGFAMAGACPAVSPSGYHQFLEWIARGYAGQMRYLEERQAAYADPSHVLPGVRSLLMLAMHYKTTPPSDTRPGQGRISRYAWGTVDYHDLIHARLKQLRDDVRDLVPEVAIRGVVDTAPLLEREFAQLAGLGWIGKHTLLLNRNSGSWFFLAALLLDVELHYDTHQSLDHCGTCTACLDACPTQAFPQPYVLDARRCISYLTIELREPIPRELRPAIGDWVFGCDICQEVCPWNRRAPLATEPEFMPTSGHDPLDLVALLSWSEDQFREHFRRTPLWRAKRRGLLRNAAIVLGNQRAADALPALIRTLDDQEPLVRGAVAWALGQFETPRADQALRDRLARETDPQVREELTLALSRSTTERCDGWHPRRPE